VLFIRDSAIQKCSRRFSIICKSENSVPYQPSGQRVIPSGRPAVHCINRQEDVTYRPDAHQTKASSVRTTWIPVWTFLCVKKLRTAPTCLRRDDSAARPDDPQCLIKPHDFFPKHRYGKIHDTVRTTWIPVRTCSSIRQVSQFKSRHPDSSQHGPDVRASDQPSGRPSSRSKRAKPLYGNYLQRTCNRPDDRASSFGHGSQTGKIFSEIFEI
jgi:hypothetical protein